MGPASCSLACPVPQSATSLGLPPPCLESSLPWLPISAPPTGLDEFFFFISLVVGLPYSLIFCPFWLFFVLKLLLSFFSLYEEVQCIYLHLQLGQKPKIRFYFLIDFIGWHWFAKPYRFEVYSSIKHHLHAVSCTYYLKQSLSMPISPYPLSTPTHPIPLSLWLSPHCCPCLCVICVCVCVYIYMGFFYLNLFFTFFPSVPQSPSLWQLSVCSMCPCLCFYFVHQFKTKQNLKQRL